ncbi:Nif3-like dinuclear metal center hexameric protein [Brasilonema sp. UFV-L1]|uniref:Nif3-like dinuclear metal center hexameric protein n=1 Tax=Brasilonema sp. UFV-L1 TaxID=2234130 RepID=UPI00145DAD38|nr:Nif3-like dinuclear metal center hexameric protein [Brasilonema sp. UFV-L1]NMG08629.1 NGG1p interacting factor NIF3 [Brasilonema sp. UFV-L1]
MITESNLILLQQITEFLDQFFAVEQYSQEERGGVYLPSTRFVRRLGLVLEPWAQLQEWVSTQDIDALFLHRPWKLEPGQLAPDIGVISYHLPFDERLTFSFNPRLAQVLGMSGLEVLGNKNGRAIGMIGDLPTQSFVRLCDCVNQIFGGYEQVHQVHAAQNPEVTRVAVVGAMTDSLVHEAATRGANIYITGQLRQPAEQALLETKIGLISVGHHRGEAWGLRALTGVLRERWSNLEVIVLHHQ